MAGVYECSTELCWIGQHGGNLFSALTFGLKLGRLKGFATGAGSSMLGGSREVGIFCCVGDFGGRHHMRRKRPFGRDWLQLTRFIPPAGQYKCKSSTLVLLRRDACQLGQDFYQQRIPNAVFW